MNNATNQILCLPSVVARDLDFAVTVMGRVAGTVDERAECLIGLFWSEGNAEDCCKYWGDGFETAHPKLYMKVKADEQPISGMTLYDWKEMPYR